jgi:hypothetical protein
MVTASNLVGKASLWGSRTIASFVICVVLILQITAGFLIKTGGRLYPFVSYPMYSQPTKGPDIAVEKLVVTFSYRSGDSVSLSLRMRKRDRKDIIERLKNGDAMAADAAGKQLDLNRPNDEIVRLKVDQETFLFSHSHLTSNSKKTETFNLRQN